MHIRTKCLLTIQFQMITLYYTLSERKMFGSLALGGLAVHYLHTIRRDEIVWHLLVFQQESKQVFSPAKESHALRP